MRLFGSTRIFGVKLVDIKNETDYNISATIRDLYDTLTEEGDNVAIYLMSPGGFTKADSLVKVKSITKDEDYKGPMYKFRDIPCGVTEEITGTDASIYCSGDTRLKMNGVIQEIDMLRISNTYEVTKMDLENPDMYSIQLDSFSDGGNIIRTSVEINGIEVMIE